MKNNNKSFLKKLKKVFRKIIRDTDSKGWFSIDELGGGGRCYFVKFILNKGCWFNKKDKELFWNTIFYFAKKNNIDIRRINKKGEHGNDFYYKILFTKRWVSLFLFFNIKW